MGALLARTARGGASMSVADAIIAATAQVHGLALATRNVDDFLHAGFVRRFGVDLAG